MFCVVFADECHQGFGDSDALIVRYGHDAADPEEPRLSDSVRHGEESDGSILEERHVAVAYRRYAVA